MDKKDGREPVLFFCHAEEVEPMGPWDVGQLLLVPTVVGLVGTLVAMWWIGDRRWDRWRGWAVAVIIAGAYALAHAQISRFPPFPAMTADEWVVYAAILGAGWAGIEAWAAESNQFRWILVAVGRLVVMSLVAWLLIGNRFGWVVLLGLSGGLTVVARVLVTAARQAFGRSLMMGWVMVAAALGPVFLMGASAKLAILAWSLMAICGGVMVVLSMSRHGKGIDLGMVQPMLVIILGGLATSGTAYANVSVEALLLAAGGLCMVAFVGALSTQRLMQLWWWKAAMVFLYALVAGATVGVAQYAEEGDKELRELQESEEDDDEDSSSERYAPYRH